MTLPDTYTAALLLTILSMICWGSWANTQKLAGKWRFELFYYDYSLAVVLTALFIALTFGSFGSRGFPFMDEMMLASDAGRRNIAYGVAAGAIFNLGNMLLVAAIAVAGLAVAFPVGIGLAMVIGVVWNYNLKPTGNATLLFTGVAIVISAIVLDALAYRAHAAVQARAEVRAGKTRSVVPKVSWKGILLSVASGVLIGSFYPLVEMGKSYGAGMGPYAIGFIFTLGIFFSTFVYNIFFMNMPVQGDPVQFRQYFRGTGRQHLLGLLGGATWAIGTITNFVVASAADPRYIESGTQTGAQLGPAISYALGQGATLISALWGLIVWKEFRGADTNVRALLTAMFILFGIGLALISIAPLYPR